MTSTHTAIHDLLRPRQTQMRASPPYSPECGSSAVLLRHSCLSLQAMLRAVRGGSTWKLVMQVPAARHSKDPTALWQPPASATTTPREQSTRAISASMTSFDSGGGSMYRNGTASAFAASLNTAAPREGRAGCSGTMTSTSTPSRHDSGCVGCDIGTMANVPTATAAGVERHSSLTKDDDVSLLERLTSRSAPGAPRADTLYPMSAGEAVVMRPMPRGAMQRGSLFDSQKARSSSCAGDAYGQKGCSTGVCICVERALIKRCLCPAII